MRPHIHNHDPDGPIAIPLVERWRFIAWLLFLALTMSLAVNLTFVFLLAYAAWGG